jgi:hypothetical protein
VVSDSTIFLTLSKLASSRVLFLLPAVAPADDDGVAVAALEFAPALATTEHDPGV